MSRNGLARHEPALRAGNRGRAPGTRAMRREPALRAGNPRHAPGTFFSSSDGSGGVQKKLGRSERTCAVRRTSFAPSPGSALTQNRLRAATTLCAQPEQVVRVQNNLRGPKKTSAGSKQSVRAQNKRCECKTSCAGVRQGARSSFRRCGGAAVPSAAGRGR